MLPAAAGNGRLSQGNNCSHRIPSPSRMGVAARAPWIVSQCTGGSPGVRFFSLRRMAAFSGPIASPGAMSAVAKMERFDRP